MATNSAHVMVGAATVSIGAYVTNAGPGTLTDVGHLIAPAELGSEFENFDVESERSFGIIKTVPIKAGFTLKIPIMESRPELLRTVLRLVSGQLTGTAPNQTLAVVDPVEQYHQIQLVSAGIGTTATRTQTYWKCQALTVEPIQYGKATVQAYNATFRILRDDSITTPTTNGLYFKQVDS